MVKTIVTRQLLLDRAAMAGRIKADGDPIN